MSAKIWRKCKLRDIANIYRGGNFQKNDFIPEGKPCIHYGQMYTHFGTFTDKVLTYLPEDVFRKSRIAVSNDVVMAITSETVEDVCSCVAWVGKEDIAISGHTVIIHHQEDAKYLSYYFHSDSFFTQKSRVAHGSKVIEINPCDLENTIIVLPKDIQEQKRISDILSTCDTVIQKTQKTIDKYKAIKQGMMQDLFTRGLTKDGKLRPAFKDAPDLYKESELGMIPKDWEVKQIENICALSSGSTPKRSNEENFSGNICWVTSGELKQKYLSDTWEKISENAMRKTNLKLYNSGTVVIAIYGQEAEGTRGSCSILDRESTISQACMAFDDFNQFDNEFFYYWYYLNGKTVAFKYAQGTKQQNLSSDSIAKLRIITPPKSEQTAIASRLSSIDTAIQKEESLLEKYKKIKAGLMNDLLVPPEDAEIIDETGE